MSPTPLGGDAKARKGDAATTRPVLVAIALAIAAVLGIGHAYWSNASTWTAPEVPAVLGSSTKSGGLHVNDVYLVPERRAQVGKMVTYDVLASIAIDPGPSDRLSFVRVDGHRAELIDGGGRQARSGLVVSSWAPLSTQPGAHRARVRINLPAADAPFGSLLSVTFEFAERGALTTSAPVWPSANWPNTAGSAAPSPSPPS